MGLGEWQEESSGVRRPRWAVHVHTKYPVLLRGVRYASNLAVSHCTDVSKTYVDAHPGADVNCAIHVSLGGSP